MLRSNCLTVLEVKTGARTVIARIWGQCFILSQPCLFFFIVSFSSFVFIVHWFMNCRVSKWSYEWVSYLKIVIWFSNVYCCTGSTLHCEKTEVCVWNFVVIVFVFAMFCRCYGLMQRSGCFQLLVHSVQELWHLANINIYLAELLAATHLASDEETPMSAWSLWFSTFYYSDAVYAILVVILCR